MTRIAVGGFLHETNTFAPTRAAYDDFVHGGGWPSMAVGSDVLKVMRDINVGLAGFIETAETYGWELVPTISCGASPSAHVTRDAFERIIKVMVDGIAAAGPSPADTLFHAAARQRYDAVLCMYHDQALIPIKTLDFDGAVNVTLGLPFIRTSPDHGTAFDIAGRGVARPDSLIAALRLAAAMAARRGAS